MMGNGFGGGGMVFGFLLMLGLLVLLVLIGLGIWALITWLRRAQSGPAGPADGRSSGALGARPGRSWTSATPEES